MLYVFNNSIIVKADVAVCWTTEHVYWSVLLLLVALYLKRGTWKTKKI